MGILDDLKNKVEKLGDKAKEGFDDARDKAGDLLDDAKDKAGDLLDDAKGRFGHDDDGSPLTESSDVGPDSSSTDAVQPGYVTAEDDVTGTAADESSLNDDLADDAEDDEPEGGVAEVEDEDFAADAPGSADLVAPAAELDAEELGTDDLATDVTEPVVDPAGEPAVETDVDPYDEPLTETIGDEIASDPVDLEAVAEAVDDASDRDPRS